MKCSPKLPVSVAAARVGILWDPWLEAQQPSSVVSKYSSGMTGPCSGILEILGREAAVLDRLEGIPNSGCSNA